jgi:hypothetical protein
VVMLDAVLVLGVLALLAYGSIRLLSAPGERRELGTGPGTWRVAHRDVHGSTRVVVQKVAPGGSVLDEHQVASIPVGDPGYDQRFLAAMSTARERRALFEAEDGD